MTEYKARIGRPNILTPEIQDEICFRLSEGESLNKICKDEHLPAKRTIMNWCSASAKQPEYKEFLHHYNRARLQQADCFVDETIDIADESEEDWFDKVLRGGDVVRAPDKELVLRSKLRVDTRLKVATMLAPKKYGDRSRLELMGKDGEPINVEAAAKVQIYLPDNGRGPTPVAKEPEEVEVAPTVDLSDCDFLG